MHVDQTIFTKRQWIKVWAGSWSVLTCSHLARQLTDIVKIEGKPFSDAIIIPVHMAKSAGYIGAKEKDVFGSRISAVYTKNPEKIKELCKNLKREVDVMRALFRNYKNNLVNLKEYKDLWKKMDEYYSYHIAVKYVVDYVPSEFLKKYLHYLQEARLYAEPVFSELELFMEEQGKIISQKVHYAPENILCMIDDEMHLYLEKNKIPSEKNLAARYNDAIFVAMNGDYEIHEGKEAQKIETLITAVKNVENLKGTSAYPGIVKGSVKVIMDPNKAENFNEGDILVTGMTRPEYIPLIKKAAGIVTDAGGILSHAAITAREMKKPCVIGTQIATKVLKNGDLVEVDAVKGIVKKL